MGQAEHSIGVLMQLKALGVSLSIDDFGTGYSSLSYLQRLPIDRLKIDQSFLSGVPENNNNAAIVRAVIALGHSLSLPVVAEGVETLQQQDFLVSNGCQLAQGYLYSKALSPQTFPQWLTAFDKKLPNDPGEYLSQPFGILISEPTRLQVIPGQ